MKSEKMLPIGTVICLKEHNTEKFMIVGYFPEDNKGNRMDYALTNYPVGMLDSRAVLFINSEAIEKVLFTGMQSEEFVLLKAVTGKMLGEEK